MRKFVSTATVLGFTNVFAAMTQRQGSPVSLCNSNNGVETFTICEVDDVNYCYNGDKRATSRSISDGIDIRDGGVGASRGILCQTSYYAYCGIRYTCEKY